MSAVDEDENCDVIRVIFNEFTSITFNFTYYLCVISGFRTEADKNCALLGYYEVSRGNFLPTFLEKLSFPSSSVQVEPIGCPETSVANRHYSLRNNPEQRSQDVMALEDRQVVLKHQLVITTTPSVITHKS